MRTWRNCLRTRRRVRPIIDPDSKEGTGNCNRRLFERVDELVEGRRYKRDALLVFFLNASGVKQLQFSET